MRSAWFILGINTPLVLDAISRMALDAGFGLMPVESILRVVWAEIPVISKSRRSGIIK